MEKTPPATWAQKYTAALSTVSAVMIAMILNNMWDMKEWKGQRNQVDQQQSESIANLTILSAQAQKERQEINHKLTYLEAMRPKEFHIKDQR